MEEFIDKENLRLKECLEKAKIIYNKSTEIHCPYFQNKITLNSDGFNHLQNKPNRMPRNIREQIVKLSLLKKALEIIPRAGTLQEYRTQMEKEGSADKNGLYKMKQVSYWGFHAILNDKIHKIKVILKRVGDGKIIFWSVMPFGQKIYSEGINID